MGVAKIKIPHSVCNVLAWLESFSVLNLGIIVAHVVSFNLHCCII